MPVAKGLINPHTECDACVVGSWCWDVCVLGAGGRQHDDSDVLLIWLHALANAGTNWNFSAPVPDWAAAIASKQELEDQISRFTTQRA